MTSSQLLTDGYTRINELVARALKDATTAELAFRPDPGANSIAWLVWHLTRVQDSHLAEIRDEDERWVSEGWAERFELPLAVASTGFGHTPDQVALLGGASRELLGGYHNDVHAHTLGFIEELGDADLERVVDTRWDPPVTLGVRLVSVLSDNLQHAGQALFVRGISGRVGN
jgi:DinB family protein